MVSLLQPLSAVLSSSQVSPAPVWGLPWAAVLREEPVPAWGLFSRGESLLQHLQHLLLLLL